ncbi:unnamed protein product [Coregonus sp. 'balchen']|nr:unnamed protein product [Coregonus sp. 'balchen']
MKRSSIGYIFITCHVELVAKDEDTVTSQHSLSIPIDVVNPPGTTISSPAFSSIPPGEEMAVSNVTTEGEGE